MPRKSSDIGNPVKEFLTSLVKTKTSAEHQEDPKKPVSQAEAIEEPIVPMMKSPIQSEPQTTEAPAKSLISNSFRADDILRSKFSSERFPSLPLMQSPSPKPPLEKETPTMKSPNFPPIRPPAFCPVVNLKHITPFEHAEKPRFRARQSSAPPPLSEPKAQKSPSPSPPSVPDEHQKKPEQKNRNSMSQSYYQPPIYSWNSWERPKFNSISGCVPVLEDSSLSNHHSYGYPPSGTNIESPFSFPYDPDYRTHSRNSTIGTCRHRSRKQHRPHKSVGNYSTFDQKSPSFSLSRTSDVPYPIMGQAYPVDIQQQQPLLLPQVVQAQPWIIPQSTQTLRPRQYYQNENVMRSNGKRQFVSSGTDDTPVQLVEPLRARRELAHIPPVTTVNATYLETITPVFIPQVANHSSQIPVNSPLEPIRYTSDVVRSMNRQAFKIGQKGSGDGPLSPRDQYLAVINDGFVKSPMRTKGDFQNGRSNGSEKRLSVKDLAKKFSNQSDNNAFVKYTKNELNMENSQDKGNLEADMYPF